MVKLVKDERKIKQVGDKFLVERNVIEEFDAQEYLQHTAQMEMQIAQAREQLKVGERMLKEFGTKKENAQKVREAEIEKAKEERESALKKEALGNKTLGK